MSWLRSTLSKARAAAAPRASLSGGAGLLVDRRSRDRYPYRYAIIVATAGFAFRGDVLGAVGQEVAHMFAREHPQHGARGPVSGTIHTGMFFVVAKAAFPVGVAADGRESVEVLKNVGTKATAAIATTAVTRARRLATGRGASSVELEAQLEKKARETKTAAGIQAMHKDWLQQIAAKESKASSEAKERELSFKELLLQSRAIEISIEVLAVDAALREQYAAPPAPEDKDSPVATLYELLSKTLSCPQAHWAEVLRLAMGADGPLLDGHVAWVVGVVSAMKADWHEEALLSERRELALRAELLRQEINAIEGPAEGASPDDERCRRRVASSAELLQTYQAVRRNLEEAQSHRHDLFEEREKDLGLIVEQLQAHIVGLQSTASASTARHKHLEVELKQSQDSIQSQLQHMDDVRVQIDQELEQLEERKKQLRRLPASRRTDRDQSFTEAFTERRSAKAGPTLAALETLHPQVALLLLRRCASFCKLVYSARTAPPELQAGALRGGYDAAQRGALGCLLAADLTDAQWHQASRGLACAGLGLRRLKAHAAGAYLASLGATRRLCSELDSNLGAAGRADIMSEMLLGAPGFMEVETNENLGLLFEPEGFLAELRRRLLLQVYDRDNFGLCCDEPCDRHGRHAVLCAGAGGWVCRHNAARNLVGRVAAAACCNPELERLPGGWPSKGLDAPQAREVVKRTHLDTEALCRQQGVFFILLVAEPRRSATQLDVMLLIEANMFLTGRPILCAALFFISLGKAFSALGALSQ
ncbi:unnamed protein product [Prorocentrum cordatum]|uniref:Uncharacterized protein n=1 Tax=Prorocentrum cordatum TaxID=2364126 RepID=A0ABN9QZ16_9DINO|nr:unnamed protein product [Polarella glacialis]